MKLQNFQQKNLEIRSKFGQLLSTEPQIKRRLNLSWSNWGFGLEPLVESVARLQKAGIEFIELHGNHYGPSLGYKAKETLQVLNDYGIKVAGTCGMFSIDNDLSSSKPVKRQAAIDYIRRELEFTAEVGGSYLLVVPGAVGRPDKYDNTEFNRSVETLSIVADDFINYCIKAAIEPIRAAEVSFIHTISDAKAYIQAVNHPGISHINGDVYHMQAEECHIGEAILEAGEMLTNLHMADSNRRGLGEGSLDLDTIIMALYVLGYNKEGCFVTPEPLGPGGAPYPAMYGLPSKKELDRMVLETASYFREREEILLSEFDNI